MSTLEDALSPFRQRTLHEQRLTFKPAAILKMGKPQHGFCETCQTYQPAPKGRHKGWECDGCVEKSRSMATSDPRNDTAVTFEGIPATDRVVLNEPDQ